MSQTFVYGPNVKHKTREYWIQGRSAPGGLMLYQPSDIWTEGETLTARCCSGKAKQTTFSCLHTQLPFYS